MDRDDGVNNFNICLSWYMSVSRCIWWILKSPLPKKWYYCYDVYAVRVMAIKWANFVSKSFGCATMAFGGWVRVCVFVLPRAIHTCAIILKQMFQKKRIEWKRNQAKPSPAKCYHHQRHRILMMATTFEFHRRQTGLLFIYFAQIVCMLVVLSVASALCQTYGMHCACTICWSLLK